jgi:hypothetical protein
MRPEVQKAFDEVWVEDEPFLRKLSEEGKLPRE